MLTGEDVTNMNSPYPEIMIVDITPDGRRFLDQTLPEPEPPRRKIGF